MALEGKQIGRYHLLRLLGSGGMGEVYLAEDARIEQQVAIKVLRTASGYSNAAAKEVARLFQREAKVIAKLDHPHILPLFDYGEAKVNGMTLTYLVMPYRKEGSFVAWLNEHRDTSILFPQEIGHFLAQAADALQHAHDRQIIHQDIKPSNFLIRSKKDAPNRPDLLLADFGVAKFSSVSASMNFSVRGTSTYMAPEQWMGQPVPGSDQYALAIMIYELLTGHPPFHGRPEQVMYQHLNVQPKPPSILNSNIYIDIDKVILTALEKKPENRFSTVSAFANAYQQALLYEPTQAVRISKDLLTTSNEDNVDEDITIKEQQPVIPSDLPRPMVALVDILEREEEHFPMNVASNKEASSPPNLATLDAAHQAVSSNINSGKREKFTPLPAPLALFSSIPSAHSGYLESIVNRWRNLNRRRAILLSLLILLLLAANIGISYAIIAGHTASVYSSSLAQANTAATARMNTIATNVIATLAAQATATTLYPYVSGQPRYDDPLKDNSKGNGWEMKPFCQFKAGTFHVSADMGNFTPCIATKTNLSNFVLEVHMTILQGDCGGVVFRRNGVAEYFLRLCKESTYTLIRYVSNSDLMMDKSILDGFSPLIHTGLNQLNQIDVVAIGSRIEVFINQQYVASVVDRGTPAFVEGQIGLYAKSENNQVPTDVTFSNLKVWML
ncbi:MAG: serine/threonine protein kinase [Chloroflexi bacterium]|nr:MAG: serine/threonine protein kinase [Chloroflexota bacterium]